MTVRRISIPALLLLLAGVLMQLLAFFELQAGTELLQYCISAPTVKRTSAADGTQSIDSGLEELYKLRGEMEETLGAALSSVSVSAVRSGESISGGGKSELATLYAVSERYLETCPAAMASGRWADASELARGERVVVLDADLAFALFGSEDPLGRDVDIYEQSYRVIGTRAHSRDVGEVDPYGAYIPLPAASSAGVQTEILCVNAVANEGSALRESFASLARERWGRGSLHDLKKMRMAAFLLTRVLLFALGMALLCRLLRAWRMLFSRYAEQIRERIRWAYASKWLLPALARIALLALTLSALLLGMYFMISFVIEPVYTFTEWVPESLVDGAAISTVFWSLISSAAQSVQHVTAQAARVAFWAIPARLGAVCTLLGVALVLARRRKISR